MWRRSVERGLDKSAWLLPAGSRVCEIGYGDGLLTCHLAKTYGWKITGLDIDPKAFEQAKAHAREFGVQDLVDLRLVSAEDSWKHQGHYDAVFIKSVLYNAKTLDEYGRWLDWVVSVLKPGGVFINFENGKANRLTYWYRKLRGRYYTDLCMYDGAVEALYRQRFSHVTTAYYGAVSQFIAPLKALYYPLAWLEETVLERTADNSYIAAIIARKPAG